MLYSVVQYVPKLVRLSTLFNCLPNPNYSYAPVRIRSFSVVHLPTRSCTGAGADRDSGLVIIFLSPDQLFAQLGAQDTPL
jgi:hypothetical protein